MQNTGESVGTKISTKAVSMATFNLHLQRAMRNAPWNHLEDEVPMIQYIGNMPRVAGITWYNGIINQKK